MLSLFLSSFGVQRIAQETKMNLLIVRLAVVPAIFAISISLTKAQSLAPQIQAIESDEHHETPAQKKLSSDLLDALRTVKGETINGVRKSPSKKQTVNRSVIVDVKGEITPELKDSIRRGGGQVIDSSSPQGHLTIVTPLNSLEGIADHPEVESLRSAAKMKLYSFHGSSSLAPIKRKSGPDTEGDVAHDGNKARSGFNVDGSGVTVCVISDSVRYLTTAQNNKSIGKVDILSTADGVQDGILKRDSFLRKATGKDSGEGTAMLEIVHRIAPGAKLAFATGNISKYHMATNIDELVKIGCKVIVDDIGWLENPFHEDEPISQAIQRASDSGVLYFTAAANGGNMKYGTSGTWEGDFKVFGGDSKCSALATQPGSLQEFSKGIYKNQILKAGGDHIDLFWNDPLGKAENQYDLFLIDQKCNIVSKANTVIDGRVDPYQRLLPPDGESFENYSLVIFKHPDAAVRHLFIDANSNILEFATDGNTHGHNASGASNAFSVAATSAKRANGAFRAGKDIRVEKYSSDGPRRVYYSVEGAAFTPSDFTASGGKLLNKPDVTAADEISTDLDGFKVFKGTSAAAPHAAAIAALILSYRPSLTAGEIRKALSSSALTIEQEGWNNLGGFGIAMPGAALQLIGRP
jgi:subtilisin family serine protease